MVGKLPDTNQKELFRPMFVDMIDMTHSMVLQLVLQHRLSAQQQPINLCYKKHYTDNKYNY